MRYIGIQHRIKKTMEGEARPTMVSLGEGDFVQELKLETEQDELDFLLGRLPTAWRGVEDGEDISHIPQHHIRERKAKDSEELARRIPATYEGLCAGDIVGMALGGSGDYFAAALSKKLETLGAGSVLRIPPNRLKEKRGDTKKDNDHALLRKLVQNEPDLFYPITLKDRDLIRVSGCFKERVEAQKARIAADNRLRQRLIGQIFLSEEGGYPEGELENLFKERRATNVILSTLLQEEKEADKRLRVAVQKLSVWSKVFKPIQGMGEAIAAGIIARVVDIRRFSKASKLVAYCGVHVLPDGKFPRKRRGSVANWDDEARQRLYLFGDQCVKNPHGEWGKYLRTAKARLRERHPDPIIGENGKKKYTDGHIHKMAIWRTLTRFTEWLYREWTKLENTNNKAHNSVPERDDQAA